MLVPVRHQQQDDLADRRRHVGGLVAVAGNEGDLDAVGGARRYGPREAGAAHEARRGGRTVEQVGVGRDDRDALVGGVQLVAFAKGGVVRAPLPVPFAQGGVIASPITFPLGGNQLGLAGERGPEAILPLARGSDGSLGVRTGGSAGTSVVFNVSTPDVDGFRRSETQIAALLARAVGNGQRNL
jgi:hypothetical protein